MERPHSGKRQFFHAFFLGLAVLSLPFSVALMRFAGSGVLLPETQEAYYPQSADALTLIAAGRTVGGERPNCFVLCRIDPAAGEVQLCVLPPETMVEDAGRFDSAAAVWHREGGARGSEAIARALGCRGDRWLELDADAFRRLCIVVGALDYTLEQPLVLPDGTTALTEGRQLLDGAKLALLIAYGGDDEAGRLALAGDLLREGFVQRLPLMGENQLLSAFETAVNWGRSDLTVRDFESRRRALTHLAARPLTVELVGISGEYNDSRNTFLPSAEMLAEIAGRFGGPAEG